MAFRTLFQADRGGSPVLDVWRQVREELAESGEDEVEAAYGDTLDREGLEFAERLVRAYSQHAQTIDDRLAGALEGWTFGQMNQTDLNVLRLAATELIHEEGVPEKVTIEMAVRTAKKYGGEESGRFVNGVLGRLYRELRSQAKDA